MSGGYAWVSSGEEVGTAVLEPRMPEQGEVGILLVDDQEDLRHMLSRALAQAGFAVMEAGSGEEALELLPEYGQRVHMLITDVMMPGIDGCELATRVVEQHPHIRVMFISGCAGQIVPPSAPFLQKPFAPKTLLRAVAKVLAAPRSAARSTGA